MNWFYNKTTRRKQTRDKLQVQYLMELPTLEQKMISEKQEMLLPDGLSHPFITKMILYPFFSPLSSPLSPVPLHNAFHNISPNLDNGLMGDYRRSLQHQRGALKLITMQKMSLQMVIQVWTLMMKIIWFLAPTARRITSFKLPPVQLIERSTSDIGLGFLLQSMHFSIM